MFVVLTVQGNSISEVRDAAQAGARAASLAHTPSEATQTGRAVALGALPVGSPTCLQADATVSTTQWSTGWVTVTVTCTAQGAPGVAPDATVTESWTEAVETGKVANG